MKHFLFLVAVVWCEGLFAQGTETFTNMPANASGYATRTWVGDNGLTWNATDARTDQTITGRAIGIRLGGVSSTGVANGIGTLTFKYAYLFTAGGNALLEVKVNGNVVGTILVPTPAIPPAIPATATINNINIPGTFTLEINQVNPSTAPPASGPRVALDDVSWTTFSGSACITPAAQPTNLVFGTVTNNSIAGSFTAATPAADGYLVIMSTSSTLAQLPVNGTTYASDDVLGNGTILTVSSQVSFAPQSLLQGTTYYFFVFTVNFACNGGPLYLTALPLTGMVATTVPPACTTPAQAPMGLTLVASNTSVTGSVIASANADGYLVVYNTSGSLNFTPQAGVTYMSGQTVGTGNTGIVAGFNQGNTFTAQSLTAGTTYYFYVFAANGFNCTSGPQYNSTSANATVATTTGTVINPPNYYDNAAGKSCVELKTSLKTITTTGMTPRSYGDLWTQYTQTDIKPREIGTGSANVIWDIYSDVPNGTDPYNFTPVINQCGNYSGEGQCYNREHSFPQSWFTGGTSTGPGTDYLHIYPTDGKVNADRGSWVYGEVANATSTSRNGSKLGSSAVAGINGTVFEPINEYKGDVARSFLYMVTRYQDNMPTWGNLSGSNGQPALEPNTYPSIDVAYIKLMLKWHTQDPVSQKERDRNNASYSFQKNRNPFIDHPEYADLVWNANCPGLSALPVQLVFFGGKLVGNQVKLNWVAENEQNFLLFDVERSFNGNSYTSIGQVKAANQRNYTFNDNAQNINGRRVYYRLKKIDKDGKYAYSEVFTLHIPLNTKFSVYPNPANSFIKLQLNGTVSGKVTVQVTNALGNVLQQQTLQSAGNTITLNTQALPNGTYLVKLLINGGQFIQKVMIAR